MFAHTEVEVPAAEITAGDGLFTVEEALVGGGQIRGPTNEIGDLLGNGVEDLAAGRPGGQVCTLGEHLQNFSQIGELFAQPSIPLAPELWKFLRPGLKESLPLVFLFLPPLLHLLRYTIDAFRCVQHFVFREAQGLLQLAHFFLTQG